MVKVLEKEEIEKLKSYQTGFEKIVFNLGNIESKIQLLIIEKNKIIFDLGNLQNQQKELALSLQNKYGEGSIDLEKGEITIY